MLVTNQSCLCTGLGVPCAVGDEDLGVGELMVVTESTFNNAHHCWTQNGTRKHGNNRCKLDKIKSCLILKQRGASYWKYVCLVPPRHPTREPGCGSRPCVLSKEEKEGSVRMKGTGEDVLRTYTRRQQSVCFYPKVQNEENYNILVITTLILS